MRSDIEIINWLRKIAEKYEADKGIQILSRIESDILIYDRTITPRGFDSRVSDCRHFPVKIIYIMNSQDVDVYVDIYHGPFEDNTNFKLNAKPILIPSNERRWGLITSRMPYIRVRAWTLKEPSRGGLSIILYKWGV